MKSNKLFIAMVTFAGLLPAASGFTEDPWKVSFGDHFGNYESKAVHAAASPDGRLAAISSTVLNTFFSNARNSSNGLAREVFPRNFRV